MAKELINLDFRTMIGSPLTAAIRAQSDAALAAVEFIKVVGSKKDENGADVPTTIDFRYTKVVDDQDQSFDLTVPLLTIVPIPNITIKEIKIEFNAKITSVEVKTSQDNTEVGISAEVKAKWGWGSAKVNASYSRQRKSTNKSESKKEYSLSVSVLAGQDDPPPGIALMVEFMEGLLVQTPTP